MFSLFQSIFAPPRDLVLLVAAAWFGLALSERRAIRYQVDSQTLSNLAFTGLSGYVIGGRVFYAAAHLSAFLQSPLSMLSLNVSAFDSWGGVAIALIASFAYGQRKGLSFWPTLDALTPLLATLGVGVGFYHLAAGQAFGTETNLPWGIQEWGAIRQPTQIYEIIAALLILLILWTKKAGTKQGSDFLTFIALTSAARLFLEAFRGDSTLVFGNLRAAQIVAFLALAVSLIGLELLKARETVAVNTQTTPAEQSTTTKKRKSKSVGRRSTSAQKGKRSEKAKAHRSE